MGQALGVATWGSHLGVMVSWCLLPGPAPAGAVACSPSQARAAQYRSKLKYIFFFDQKGQFISAKGHSGPSSM